MRKVFFGATLLVLLAGCAPEPIVVVVPDRGTVLPEMDELQTVSPDNFAADVVAEREGIVEGFFDPSFDEFPFDAFPYVELKNNSLTTLYNFSLSGVVYDDQGSIWFPDILSPELLIGPGERVIIVESAFNSASASVPTEVEFSYDVVSARQIAEGEAGGLSVENTVWSAGDFGAFSISGTVVNPLQVPVDGFVVYGWCYATDGNMYGAYSSVFYPPEGALNSGESRAFQLDGNASTRAQIDSCEASAVRTASF